MSKKLNDWLDEFVENGANPNKVTEWLENAGGGGTKIVDALPAEGEEGSTYLLRKSKEFKGTYYAGLSNVNGEFCHFIVSNEFTSEDLEKEIINKLGIDPDNLPPDFEYYQEEINVITTEEFKTEYANAMFVNSIDEFPQTRPDVSVLINYGEIKTSDYVAIEHKGGNDEQTYYYITAFPNLNTFNAETIVQNNQVVLRDREVIYYKGQLRIGEWENYLERTIYATFTNECPLDHESYELLDFNNCYYIDISASEYTYTEYVFDQGIYTEVSAKSEDGNIINILSVEDQTMILDKTTKTIYGMLDKGPVLFKDFRNPNKKEYPGLIIIGKYNEATNKYNFNIIVYENYIDLGYNNETDTWWYSYVH